MQITRSRIIKYLNSNKVATSLELSRSLMLTPANIRHHLDILLDNGMVQEYGTLPVSGRGRPKKVFTLTPQAQDDNLGALASALIKTLLFRDGEIDVRSDHLSKVAVEMSGKTDTVVQSIIQNMNLTIKRLNEMNYQARWEAHEQGPLIAFGNCPYSKIISRHPELCIMDSRLLEEMLDMSFTQVSKFFEDLHDKKQCVFMLSAENPKI